MGEEKESWKVKTLDEILQEKKRRKEQEEKADTKRLKNSDDRDSKRDSLEEGELRDHRMEITIRNSPYRREDSMEDRGEEDDSLAIKPPQQMSRKEKAHHRKDEKRKEKRRHRSHSAEGACLAFLLRPPESLWGRWRRGYKNKIIIIILNPSFLSKIFRLSKVLPGAVRFG
uniref:Uncharacterized protein n=1 Tax=Anolis carolinensis TaxID=28377 RepID=H9G5U1_ANOCA